MQKLMARDIYLDRLLKFRDTEPVKVITGVRRCGKSSLLSLLEARLLESGVQADNIIRINFEKLEFDEIADYRQLNDFILGKKIKGRTTYILVDEIQHIDSWEKTVNSLRLDDTNDIYITGSNAQLLSSELATIIAGRYVEIKMLPLSFSEYLQFHEGSGKSEDDLFASYLEYGGFPGLTGIPDDRESKRIFLDGILNTILIRDVVTRNNIRDVALMEKLLRYLANNFASPFSQKKIVGYLNGIGRKTREETIESYLGMLEKAFVIYKAQRYDIKGKELLSTQGKYYFVDTGLKNLLLAKSGFDFGATLENLVYFELIRRGYTVSIGKAGSFEVDFVTEDQDERRYFQVTASILSDETREREVRSMQAIGDHFPKYILTMDKAPFGNFDGIKVVNILDFLKGNKVL